MAAVKLFYFVAKNKLRGKWISKRSGEFMPEGGAAVIGPKGKRQSFTGGVAHANKA